MMDALDSNYCSSFTALNIIDYEKMRLHNLYMKAPNYKKVFLDLENFEKETKLLTDRLGIEHNTNYLLYTMKELALTIPFESVFLNFYAEQIHKNKVSNSFKDILMSEYIQYLDKILRTTLHSNEIWTIVKKFLKVLKLLELQSELSFENLHQYEFMANLLRLCCEVNVQDSEVVTTLVKMVIDRYVTDGSDLRYVQHPVYPYKFFSYILKHVTCEKFDIGLYCSNHSQTLWQYSRNFSPVHAAAFGNVERVLSLLQHGFDVFPESEAKNSGHGYLFIEETMSRYNLMILHIMSRMRLVNCFSFDHSGTMDQSFYNVTENQEECFRLIWRAIPEPYVRRPQLELDISTEYFYLALHAIFKPFRYSRNLKLGIMYESCFTDMATGPYEPRSLKHLSRCFIRKRLRETWRLPNGVFHLCLPSLLEKYLNLEID
ncbi:SOCS box domain-containing protein [Nephila pilipes]|uniref:SOCS box domain-containing protein n=1 Tax=Nephila pilipes TaxID=299642 RepID=A0A8X6U4P8_NEPPI|nr:SOCS box domain-containing protein [Nephila pilipes]